MIYNYNLSGILIGTYCSLIGSLGDSFVIHNDLQDSIQLENTSYTLPIWFGITLQFISTCLNSLIFYYLPLLMVMPFVALHVLLNSLISSLCLEMKFSCSDLFSFLFISSGVVLCLISGPKQAELIQFNDLFSNDDTYYYIVTSITVLFIAVLFTHIKVNKPINVTKGLSTSLTNSKCNKILYERFVYWTFLSFLCGVAGACSSILTRNSITINHNYTKLSMICGSFLCKYIEYLNFNSGSLDYLAYRPNISVKLRVLIDIYWTILGGMVINRELPVLFEFYFLGVSFISIGILLSGVTIACIDPPATHLIITSLCSTIDYKDNPLSTLAFSCKKKFLAITDAAIYISFKNALLKNFYGVLVLHDRIEAMNGGIGRSEIEII